MRFFKWGLGLFFFLLLSFKSNAASWHFEWEQTYIEVPLYANIDLYVTIPFARLYKDNHLLEDAEITYQRTGDWLYLLSDVDTTKIGTYQVWYKAYEKKYLPGQCQGYKTLVTFQVTDDVPPVFSESNPKEITHLIGSPYPDYQQLFHATDNSGSCQITVRDDQVQYQIPGIYPLFVTAFDGTLSTEVVVDVIVKDLEAPQIECFLENRKLVVEQYETVSLLPYFKATDQIDGDVTDSLSASFFSTDQVGQYNVTVTFEDRQHNQSKMTIVLEVVNTKELVLSLLSDELVLDYTGSYDASFFKQNIQTSTYGTDNLLEEVEVDLSALKKKVGTYTIWYSIDHANQQKEVSCKVVLLSYEKPILEVSEINIPLGESFSYLDYIFVSDASDDEILKTLVIDYGKVDYTKEGRYQVMASVTNSSGLTTTKYFVLTIEKSSESDDVVKWGLLGVGLVLVCYLGYRFIRKRK